MFNIITKDIQYINSKILENDGQTFLVGGIVRDALLSIPSKDIDIEVFNIASYKLYEILNLIGHVKLVGSSFGVYKFTFNSNEYDISLPRKDVKISEGHKGFKVVVDSHMSYKEAASRRDFTINSLMINISTGEILDFFGGIADLNNKILRATSNRFSEDVLRPLRAVQFAGRFNMTVEDNTAEMCKKLALEFHTLSQDRIMIEFMKLAEKSKFPSKALKALMKIRWDCFFPQLKIDSKKFQIIDNIAKILQSNADFTSEDRNVLFYTVLTYDMSQKETLNFLNKIGMPNIIKKRIMALKIGLDYCYFTSLPSNKKSANNLAHKLGLESIDNLMHVLTALEGKLTNFQNDLYAIAKSIGINGNPPSPLITGKDLIELGIKSGPQMGNILNEVYTKTLDGDINSSEEALEYVKSVI